MRTHHQAPGMAACLLAALAPINAGDTALETAATDTALLDVGACQATRTPGTEEGDTVELRVPLQLQPGADVPAEDLTVSVTVFRLTEDLDIVPVAEHPIELQPGLQGPLPGGGLRLVIRFTLPARPCYGYTAHLHVGGKVQHTIASTAELLPQPPDTETPAAPAGPDTPPAEPQLLPAPTEEATPYSDFLKDNPRPDA